MTSDKQPTVSGAAMAGELSQDEFVLPHLQAWRAAGLRVALLTLVGIDGGSPRPLGAQMAVGEDGRHAGYLSGGCLEHSLALEAVAAIRDGGCRLIRYGKGSPYLDIALPCGSGLDILIAPDPSQDALERALAAAARREPFALDIDLATGALAVSAQTRKSVGPKPEDAHVFHRVYWPAVRIVLIGSGPLIPALAAIAVAAGLDVEAASPDAATLEALACSGTPGRPMPSPRLPHLAEADRFTAAVLAFHEHEREGQLLADLLTSQCFYIGALGSRVVHAARLASLALAGVSPDAMARIRGPIGLIPGAKSVGPLAVGILADILATAKANGLVD